MTSYSSKVIRRGISIIIRTSLYEFEAQGPGTPDYKIFIFNKLGGAILVLSNMQTFFPYIKLTTSLETGKGSLCMEVAYLNYVRLCNHEMFNSGIT